MKIYGVIMAGGGGTRFWPLSRKKTPKQLLNLSGKELMINEAVDRLSLVTERSNIFVVTNTSQAEQMLKATSGRIEPDHILIEPAARNTAACIGYSAFEIVKKYGDGIMVITPSDAYIRNNEEFARVLQIAIDEAEQTDSLLTVGITPTYPATGYGYINFETSKNPIKNVLKFVEKPNRETAQTYLLDGSYVWNSGMFIWKASVILKYFKQFLPDIYINLEKISEKMGTFQEKYTIESIYPKLRSISIDFGIMEKADNIKVVPGEFGWSDVGSWDMLGALNESDKDGNVKVGNILCVESRGNVVYSGDRLVTLVGVEDMVVVSTPDAVMVCPKSKTQDVKKIVDKLTLDGKEEWL